MNDLPSEMSVEHYSPSDDPIHVIETPEDSLVDENEKRDDDVSWIRADDNEAMMEKYMAHIPDLETVSETHHTWDIENWRGLTKREHGPTFECAGIPWKVLFFPFGNNVDFASFYLEHGYDDKPPEDWYACAQFLLVLWNPNDPRIYTQHAAQHRFTQDEGDWGFTRFAELRKLFDSKWENFDRPLIEGNTARLTAYVRVVKDPTGVLWHSFINYDSKKETGMVGLKNQGATCYLNSLLQSLYFTTAFRKAVYQIPIDVDEPPRENSAYALQRLFLQLQKSDTAVPTTELTASFGWSSREIFEQQDVQELSRVLMEKMEEKMKGTEAEDALSNMFVGKTKTYISCINVDYQSSKIEDYWDVQLNVSKMTGVDESFTEYITPEIMDGENKYAAEGHGLQDAKKGVIFESFPSVLHLQLKRFEYDWQRDVMMKLNDRFEFPETWDASPYLSENADRSEPHIYKLHGVLVHSGDLHAGHYYAFLKPTKDGHFYKFDDDRVTRATLKEAIDDNFGGEYIVPNGHIPHRSPNAKPLKRVNSAYMLVYIRECHMDRVLLAQDVVEPPSAIAEKIADERAQWEVKKKQKEEAHLYAEVIVAIEDNFKHHQGMDLVPIPANDLTEEAAKVDSYRIRKKATIAEFITDFAQFKNLDPELIRPWCMVNRQNGTTRPDQPITDNEMNIEEASVKFGHKGQLRIWFENAIGKDKDGKAIYGDAEVDLNVRGARENEKPMILFLKYFDVDKQTLYGIGHFYALPSEKVSDLSAQILKLMKWTPGTSYKIFEEIKSNMIEPMKPKMTLQQAELQDGDIVTVQKAITEQDASQLGGKLVEVKEFYDWLINRVLIRFVPKSDSTKALPEFILPLSKKTLYVDIARAVGEHIGEKPDFLRLHTVNQQNGKPKNVVRHNHNYSLGQILSPQYASYGTHIRPDALYYEVLECSVTELDQRRLIKITWLPDGQNKEEPYELLVKKTGSVADLVQHLVQKANIPEELTRRIRVFETHGHRNSKDLTPQSAVLNLSDYGSLCADLRSEDELEPEENDRIGHGFNYDREQTKGHSYPFSFLVKEGELFGATKERIAKRINAKGKALEKIKFSIVGKSGYNKPEYLSDEDILSEKMTPNDYLGLDHPTKNRSNLRSDQIFIR